MASLHLVGCSPTAPMFRHPALFDRLAGGWPLKSRRDDRNQSAFQGRVIGPSPFHCNSNRTPPLRLTAHRIKLFANFAELFTHASGRNRHDDRLYGSYFLSSHAFLLGHSKQILHSRIAPHGHGSSELDKVSCLRVHYLGGIGRLRKESERVFR